MKYTKIRKQKNKKKIENTKVQHSLFKVESNNEQRRTNRLAAVICILALSSYIIINSIKFALSLINIWPQKGTVYISMQIVVTIFLTVIFYLFANLMYFFYIDIHRYDIHKKNLQYYDIKSDQKYNEFIDNFKRCLPLIFIAGFTLLICIFLDNKLNLIYLFVIILLINILLVYIILTIKPKEIPFYKYCYQHYYKKIKYIDYSFYIKFLILSVIIYVIALAFIIKSNNLMTIECNKNGEIKIEIESNEYCDLYYYIFDKNETNLLYSGIINKSDAKIARVDTMVGKTISDENNKNINSAGIIINAERTFSIYNINLSLIDLSNDTYIIEFASKVNSRTALIRDQFMITDGVYFFTKDKMSHNY